VAPLRARALVESHASRALKHEITDQYVKIEINKHHRIAVAAQIVVATTSKATHSADEDATAISLLPGNGLQPYFCHCRPHPEEYGRWNARDIATIGEYRLFPLVVREESAAR
jgi:hypothetical protein